MREAKRRPDPKQKERGFNPASLPGKYGGADVHDIIKYGNTAWMEKYNEHSRAGNKLAALGWAVAGTPRKGIMQRYEVTGKNTVTPQLSPGQESVIRGFEAAQTVVTLAKTILSDSKDKPKGAVRKQLREVLNAGKSMRERRKERIKSGGGLFNRLIGDRYAKGAMRDKLNRPYVTDADVEYWRSREKGPDPVTKVDLKKPDKTTPDTQPVTPPVDLRKHEKVDLKKPDKTSVPDTDPITAPIPIIDLNKNGQSAPDATNSNTTTGASEPETPSAPDQNGETQDNSRSGPDPLPRWVVDALMAKLEQDAAESARRDAAISSEKPGQVDNTGHVVIDMTAVDGTPRTEEDFVRNSDAELPPEPQVGATTKASIRNQEAEYTQPTARGTKSKSM